MAILKKEELKVIPMISLLGIQICLNIALLILSIGITIQSFKELNINRNLAYRSMIGWACVVLLTITDLTINLSEFLK